MSKATKSAEAEQEREEIGHLLRERAEIDRQLAERQATLARLIATP